jgi:hypothetical protein
MDSAARKLTHGLVILAWYGISMSMAWVHRVVLRVDVGGCVFGDQPLGFFAGDCLLTHNWCGVIVRIRGGSGLSNHAEGQVSDRV